MLRLNSLLILMYLMTVADNAFTQQSNIWYFGTGAGISFNPQGVGVIPYPVSTSVMDASEGAATICDINGNILFYTNGEIVYNKNNQVMLNGSGLMGHVSAFQSSLIVPAPGHDSLYYIFTADAFENNFANGYRYSLVNINRDNGNGEVISKNNLLYRTSCERLTAARHANGIDVWVITNELNSNRFLAYLITCNGIQFNPVISSVGDVLNSHSNMSFGAMKVSPDGKQLCQTHFAESDIFFTGNFFQIFDFDNATGVLTNPRKIMTSGSRYLACEYSPDSKLLYVTKEQTAEIDQFEATLASAALITSSRVSIPASTGFFGLQLGPDNKIYATRYSFNLSVISNPDVKGTGCNFELDKISITGRSGLNLPSFVNDLALNRIMSYAITDSCTGRVQFNAQSVLPGAQYNWDFGDGNTSTQQNPVHNFAATSQFYIVKLTITSPTACGVIQRSLPVFPGGISASASFDFINQCDSGFVRFTNTSVVFPDSNYQFLWDFGDGSTSTAASPVHSFPGSGTFNVKLKIITSKACLDDSVTRQLDLQVLDIQAPPDQTIDIGQSVQLYVNGGGNQFLWTPPTGLSNPAASNPVAKPLTDITYTVRATNISGCADTDSVTIKVRPANNIYVPSGFTPNNDGLNDIVRPFLGFGFVLEEFTVYNRWGQKVFTTDKETTGWDGMIKGILQSAGIFAWYLRAKDPNGKTIEQKGTVTLIR